MLYHLYEFNRAALTPFRFAAEVGQAAFRHPFNPWTYTDAGKRVAAALDVFEGATRRYGKPKFGLGQTTVDGVPVAIREQEVWRKPFCTLKFFERDQRAMRRLKRETDAQVLIVAPMSGHYATLLRGTVEAMLPGHDVYITDWHNARMVPLWEGKFDLDDYVDYIVEILQFLGPNTHIIGVCQPSVPVLAAVSLLAEMDDPCQPASMTLMGGPIDTRRNPTVPNELATSRPIDWFETNVINLVPFPYPGAMRRVYPGFLQLTGFMTMNLERHITAHQNLFQHLVEGDGDSAAAHRRFYDEYLAVMDMTAEFYLQTVRMVFQEHALPKGEWQHRGHPVDPSLIKKTALMTVEGEKDDISGLGQTQAAQDLCSALSKSMREHYVQPEVGHYGVFNGSRWRAEIQPRVAEFIQKHDAGQ